MELVPIPLQGLFMGFYTLVAECFNAGLIRRN